MTRPLIGITTYQEAARWGVWVREAALLATAYPRAVERGGGVAVLLPPPAGLDGVEVLVSRLDGLVIAGGPDVEPARYGEEPHESTGGPDVESDPEPDTDAHRKPPLARRALPHADDRLPRKRRPVPGAVAGHAAAIRRGLR